jgi:hypothetical protein
MNEPSQFAASFEDLSFVHHLQFKLSSVKILILAKDLRDIPLQSLDLEGDLCCPMLRAVVIRIDKARSGARAPPKSALVRGIQRLCEWLDRRHANGAAPLDRIVLPRISNIGDESLRMLRDRAAEVIV